jgi:hypothetical protein
MRPFAGLQLAHEVGAHAPLTARLPRDQAVPFQAIEPSHVGLHEVGGRRLTMPFTDDGARSEGHSRGIYTSGGDRGFVPNN